MDARWNLVHATHTSPQELAGIAQAGASIVICPSTEANLGDGVFDLPGYAAVQGAWSIGSDSHVTRSWVEELRLLEYSQRLSQRQRNIAAYYLGKNSPDPSSSGSSSSAAALLQATLHGGLAASGLPLSGIAVGQRADFAALDSRSSALQGMPDDYVLDALVFSSPSANFVQTFVAGRLATGGQSADFAQVMQALWA